MWADGEGRGGEGLLRGDVAGVARGIRLVREEEVAVAVAAAVEVSGPFDSPLLAPVFVTQVWADRFGCRNTSLEGGPSRALLGVWEADAHRVEVRERGREAGECLPGGSVTLWTLPGAPHFPRFSDAFPSLLAEFIAQRASNPRRTQPPDSSGATLLPTRGKASGGSSAGTALLAAPSEAATGVIAGAPLLPTQPLPELPDEAAPGRTVFGHHVLF